MSKELTPLEAWQVIKETLTRYKVPNLVKSIDNLEELKIIKNALNDYEKIKEEVKNLRKAFYEECDEITKLCNTYEKKLKALEIIKEKEVNVYWLMHYHTLDAYNQQVSPVRKLTQEEYDLLKEVLL